MKTYTIPISNSEDLNNIKCPLPIEIIPNNMDINLCSVDNITWNVQEDGQLLSLTINFLPDPKE